MGFFRNLRKARLGDQTEDLAIREAPPTWKPAGPNYFEMMRQRDSKAYDAILSRILGFVSPHVYDTTYCSLDEVDLGETCMLCNTRDLAHCVLTCKAWSAPATRLLYTSIRIDSLHYCPLESELRAKRAKKTKGLIRGSRYKNPDDDYVYDPVTDPTHERVHLLAETLRANAPLACLVSYLKLAYTVRETVNVDVTRAISACSNIMYADLPSGFYRGDARFEMLRREVSTNCPNLRFMRFVEGAEQRTERYFRQMGDSNVWPRLECLSLEGVRIDVASFRYTLASLPRLKSLVLTEIPEISDDAFSTAPGIPDFPPIQNLELHGLPLVTVSGILKYLTVPHARDALTSLALDNTGVRISTLHSVLAHAPCLESLTVLATVERALPLDPLPPLAHPGLEVLHLDLTDADPKSAITPRPTDSCHAYLLNSVLSHCLPALRALYVRDPSLPEALARARVQGVRASSIFGVQHLGSISLAYGQPAARAPLQELEVYTRGHSESAWVFSPIQARRHSHHSGRDASRRSSHAGHAHTEFDQHRRESAVNLEWRANARRSIMVSSPAGGFLSVSDEDLSSPAPLLQKRSSSRLGGVDEKEVQIEHVEEVHDGYDVHVRSAAEEIMRKNYSVGAGATGMGRSGREEAKRGSWWDNHAGNGRRGSAGDLWR